MRARRYLIGLALCVVLCAGCEFYDSGKKAEAGANTAAAAAKDIAKSVDSAEPVIEALENASGKTLDPEVVSKIESFMEKLEKYSKTAQKGAAVGAVVPGPQQPWLAAIATALGAVTGLAGALKGLAERRRRQRTEKGLRSVIVAVDDIPGIGAKIISKTTKAGVSDVVEDQYAAAKSP